MVDGVHSAGYFTQNACQLADLAALTLQDVDPAQVPHAADILKKIPIYHVPDLMGALHETKERRALMAEWAWVFSQGPGVLVLKHAYTDTAIIDRATDIFNDIIAQETESLGAGADHFAAAGNNDRIWNSLQKLCLRGPDIFTRYFANPAFDAACEAWLGPNYQVTAQVNLVRPGGKAQTCHRDYHLGFQTADMCAKYPAHVHILSPLMTLQGGIAHCDMPIESGPTKLLPFSQKYDAGYAAYRRPDFQAHFEDNFVQLPLEKGDCIFFNPALYHAAGDNHSKDIARLVNLVQVGSAMGRTLENVDRKSMCKAIFPALKALSANHELSQSQLNATIAACAEGYPFPTNLDNDPPIGGLAPESQADIMRKALDETWSDGDLHRALDAQSKKQRA